MDLKKIADLGASIGKSQTLRMVAAHCRAADAECLKQIKETHAYKTMGYTWDNFCSEFLHLHSREYTVERNRLPTSRHPVENRPMLHSTVSLARPWLANDVRIAAEHAQHTTKW